MSFFFPNFNSPRGGGAAGGEFRVVLEAQDIILQGETDTYDLPAPPAGKKYEYLECNFLCAFNTLTATRSTVQGSANINRSDGKFIEDSSGDQSSWYSSFYGGTNGFEYFDGGNDVSATTFAVGLVHIKGAARFWSVEYDPDTHQLSFFRSTGAPTAALNPIVWGALIVGYLVDV